MTVSAIDSAGTSSAESELVKYQQKLAADLAAKASAKVAETDRERVIAQDRSAVAKAQQAVQREKETTQTVSTSGFQSKLDVTV
ncbi:hypothetical protein [Paractinoplanes durhamensis]|uniref:Uncharacterized protein n=1 Tax=Paractinoplanes durhamensis TaxID=113563 RepID=A0ABQ3Z9W1_9ACTN|nr:hypothetical protein [Actinoplanes durhamensis]GIE06600.1 hypothetical protein Adu01nite_79500 [Actinoplanes durhamensis]